MEKELWKLLKKYQQFEKFASLEPKQVLKMFWGRHLWGRGYFVATSGNITDEVIMEYIKNQDENEDSGDFTIA